MQRIKWVDERLQQWAHWRLAGGGGYKSPSFSEASGRYTGDPYNSYVEFSAEQESKALEMDGALAALPKELGRVVIAYYTWQGGMTTLAEKLRITRATIHRRLCHADIRIVAWLDARSTMEQALRERKLV